MLAVTTRRLLLAGLVVAVAGALLGLVVVATRDHGWQVPDSAGSYVGTVGSVVVTVSPSQVNGWDLASGEHRWRWRSDTRSASEALRVGERVVLRSGDDVVALDGGSGRERWRVALPVGLDPVTADGDVLVLTRRDGTGSLALDVTDGHTVWEMPGRAGVSSQAEELASSVRSYGSPYVIVDGVDAGVSRLQVVEVRTGVVTRSVPGAAEFTLQGNHLLTRALVLQKDPRRYELGPWQGYEVGNTAAPWSAPVDVTSPWVGEGPSPAQSDAVIDGLQVPDRRWLGLDAGTGEIRPLRPPRGWRWAGAPEQAAFDAVEPGTVLVSRSGAAGVWQIGERSVTMLPDDERRLAAFAAPGIYAQFVRAERRIGGTVTRIDLAQDGEVHSLTVDLEPTDHLQLVVIDETVAVLDRGRLALVVPVADFG